MSFLQAHVTFFNYLTSVQRSGFRSCDFRDIRSATGYCGWSPFGVPGSNLCHLSNEENSMTEEVPDVVLHQFHDMNMVLHEFLLEVSMLMATILL